MHILTHNGKITVKSPTGEHRVFKVQTQPKKSKFAPGKRVLSVKEGLKWISFAFVYSKEGEYTGRIEIWSRYSTPTTTPWKDKTAYERYIALLLNEEHYIKKGCEYKKEGTCRVCNRKLTDPDSIDSGIGPVCANLRAGLR